MENNNTPNQDQVKEQKQTQIKEEKKPIDYEKIIKKHSLNLYKFKKQFEESFYKKGNFDSKDFENFKRELSKIDNDILKSFEIKFTDKQKSEILDFLD